MPAHSPQIVAHIAEHAALREVRARRCNLTDEGLQALSSHCKHLTALDLSESHMINVDGLLSLAPVAPNLKKLRLLGLPCEDSFCETVLAHATSLTELCLSHCRWISDAGWARLASLHNLELFQAFHSSLTGARCKWLTLQWPRLNRVLDVRGIRFTKEELLEMRAKLPSSCKITFLLGSSDALIEGEDEKEEDEDEEDPQAAPDGGNQA